VLVEDVEDQGPAFDALEAFSIITGGARTQLPPYPTLRTPMGGAMHPASAALQADGIPTEEEAGACLFPVDFSSRMTLDLLHVSRCAVRREPGSGRGGGGGFYALLLGVTIVDHRRIPPNPGIAEVNGDRLCILRRHPLFLLCIPPHLPYPHPHACQ